MFVLDTCTEGRENGQDKVMFYRDGGGKKRTKKAEGQREEDSKTQRKWSVEKHSELPGANVQQHTV